MERVPDWGRERSQEGGGGTRKTKKGGKWRVRVRRCNAMRLSVSDRRFNAPERRFSATLSADDSDYYVDIDKGEVRAGRNIPARFTKSLSPRAAQFCLTCLPIPTLFLVKRRLLGCVIPRTWQVNATHLLPCLSCLVDDEAPQGSSSCIMDGVSEGVPLSIVFFQFETAFCGTFRVSDSRLREQRRHVLQLLQDHKRRIAGRETHKNAALKTFLFDMIMNYGITND